MVEKVIGVLGGMGPEATIAFYSRITAHTGAKRDQDHLNVIIHSNPKVPDRTAAAMGAGPSPVPLLASGVDALKRAGADFVVIPCVSAHIFLDELKQGISLPVISILDVVADELRGDPRGILKVGLLATSGTVKAGLFQRRLAECGIEVVLPPAEDQARVAAAIYEVKAGPAATRRREITRDLCGVSQRLFDAGARGIILGCTEIPLVLGSADLPIPVFDSLSLLARAAIRAAGRTPLVVESREQGRTE